MVVNRTKLALPIRHSPAEETASAVAPSSARPSAKRPVAGVLEHLTPRNGTTSLQQPIQLAITDAAVPRNRISLPNAHQPKPSVVNSEARRVSPQIKAALDAGLQRWLFSSAETRGKTRQNLPPGSERRDIEAITGNLIRNVIIRKYPGKRDVYQVLHEDGTLNGRFTVSTRANGKLIIEATMKAGAYDESWNYVPGTNRNDYSLGQDAANPIGFAHSDNTSMTDIFDNTGTQHTPDIGMGGGFANFYDEATQQGAAQSTQVKEIMCV